MSVVHYKCHLCGVVCACSSIVEVLRITLRCGVSCSPIVVSSAGMEDHVSTSPGSDAILHYVGLCEVCERLQHSDCQQLKEWGLALKKHWKDILKTKLSR